jgi:hypothetical protein
MKRFSFSIALTICFLLLSCGKKEDCACMSIVLEEEGSVLNTGEAPLARKATNVISEWIASTSTDSAVALMRARGLPMPDPFDPAFLRGGLSNDISDATAVINLRFCGEAGEPFAVNFLNAWLRIADDRDVRERSEIFATTITNLEREEEKLKSELEKTELRMSSQKSEADKGGIQEDSDKFRYLANESDMRENELSLLLEKKIELAIMKASVASRVRVMSPAEPCK